MKTKDKIVSLELAKQLLEYIELDAANVYLDSEYVIYNMENGAIRSHQIQIPAPDMSELLSIIPWRIEEYHLDFLHIDNTYSVGYYNGYYHETLADYLVADTLQDALCKLAIWLFENKYLEAK